MSAAFLGQKAKSAHPKQPTFKPDVSKYRNGVTERINAAVPGSAYSKASIRAATANFKQGGNNNPTSASFLQPKVVKEPKSGRKEPTFKPTLTSTKKGVILRSKIQSKALDTKPVTEKMRSRKSEAKASVQTVSRYTLLLDKGRETFNDDDGAKDIPEFVLDGTKVAASQQVLRCFLQRLLCQLCRITSSHILWHIVFTRTC